MGVFTIKFILLFVTLSFAFGDISIDMKVEEGNQKAVNTSFPAECGGKISRPMRPGKCPKFPTAVACPPCADQCNKDADCPLPKKCCFHPGCGNKCVSVIYAMGG